MAKARTISGRSRRGRLADPNGPPAATARWAEISSVFPAPPQPAAEGAAISPPVPAGAASGLFVVDISEDLEITGKFLCRVPMANDVLYCSCGGVLSQRFNESYFCRTCGREGSR